MSENLCDSCDHGCRCDCCVYWRRHVHRVAGNRDRATAHVQAKLDWTEEKLRRADNYGNEVRRKYWEIEGNNRDLRREVQKLERYIAKKHKQGFLSKLLEKLA